MSISNLSGKVAVIIGGTGGMARVVVRATDVALATERPSGLSIRNVLEGTVGAVRPGEGPVTIVDIALGDSGALTATVTRMAAEELGLAAGDRVYALIKTVALDERPIA